MGMLDGLLGGAVGAEMATVVNGLIEKHGGVQGIVAQLEQQGLGGTVLKSNVDLERVKLIQATLQEKISSPQR